MKKAKYVCRCCASTIKDIFLDLGKTPLANSFLKKSNLKKKEKVYPLKTYVCKNCFLVQLPKYSNPQKIFSEYAYFSSYSSDWLNHAKNYVKIITKKLKLNSQHMVIEIASNDGYLLQYFLIKKIPVLGIEPAKNIAKVAQKKNIKTEVAFFNEKLAKRLKKDGNSADLIIANNVLAHNPNLHNFIKGVKIILKPNGTITLEVPHLLKLIQNAEFDTIYHEHFSYFFVKSIKKII